MITVSMLYNRWYRVVWDRIALPLLSSGMFYSSMSELIQIRQLRNTHLTRIGIGWVAWAKAPTLYYNQSH